MEVDERLSRAHGFDQRNDAHDARVKFRSRALTALNLLPSIATLASANSSSRRHRAPTSAVSGKAAVWLGGVRLPQLTLSGYDRQTPCNCQME